MDMTFSTYSTDDGGSLAALRLISFRGEPALVESHVVELQQSISVFPFSKPGTKAEFTWQLRTHLGLSQWDVVAASPKSLAVVATAPGSSRSPLTVSVTDATNEIALTGKYVMGVFPQPRFVKGRAETEATVVAVRSDEFPPRVVVFGDALLAAGAAVDIPVTGGVLERAAIVRSGVGYLLVYKTYGTPEGGANSGQPMPMRKVRSMNGEIRSGPLFCLRLDAHFKAIGDAEKLNGPDVFEFDVDEADGRAVLFATTSGGFRLGIGVESGGEGLPKWTWRETDRPGILESPAVLTKAGDVYLAAIETAASHPAKILTLKLSGK